MDSVGRHHLCLYLLAGVSIWLSFTLYHVQGVTIEKRNCSFPSFLQEACSEPGKACRQWSQRKRLEQERTDAFYGNNSYSSKPRIEQYTWVFNGGRIEILFKDNYSSRMTPLTFYCWQKLAPHIFVISSKVVRNESDSNVKYSCVRFRKRGRNVIEYEQSPWKDNHTRLACDASDLVLSENPLISTPFQELADCPAELNGGFQIMQLFNGETGKQCVYNNETDSTAMLESDCLGKEGLIIQLPQKRDCFPRRREFDSGHYHLGFYCYSAPWREKHFTYFIVKRQNVKTLFDPLSGDMESDFLCARFQKVLKESGEEFHLQVYKQPICWQNESAASVFLIIHMKRGRNLDQSARFPSEVNETECSFPEKFQGIWREISLHNGLQTVVINKTAVNISPYGRFHCKQQHIFQHQAPYKCSALATGKWPGTGRAKFSIHDYLIISNFSNGCRTRVTRFGVTDVIGQDVLIYRLSQSVPIASGVGNSEEYFIYHVLKKFCSSWLPYFKDPYPIWGRNIEKIITKHPERTKHHCPVPALGKGVYHFKSVYSDQSECSGPASRVRFACDSPFTFKVQYDPRCQMSDVSFTCLGKARKIGEFFLVRDGKTERINCMWFDNENNQLLRLNSPQCSDFDWGKLPGKGKNYAERFVYQYHSKCPLVKYNYPIIIRVRSASRNFHVSPTFIIPTCLLFVTMFCTSGIGF